MTPIFVSHASADKPALSPIFSELVRAEVSLFLDQRGCGIIWDPDVEQIAYGGDQYVSDTPSGNYNDSIRDAINACSIFVGMITDNFVNNEACLRELVLFLTLRNTAEAPPPLLIQALPMAKKREIPLEALGGAFLTASANLMNIKRAPEALFQNDGATQWVAGEIKKAYMLANADSIIARLQEKQHEDCKRYADGATVRSYALFPRRSVDFVFVPKIASGLGAFVSARPLGPAGHACDQTITADQVRRLLRNLPKGVQPLKQGELTALYIAFSGDRSCPSPYGLPPRAVSDPFWVVRDGRLEAVNLSGRPQPGERAYLHIRRT